MGLKSLLERKKIGQIFKMVGRWKLIFSLGLNKSGVRPSMAQVLFPLSA